MIATVYNIYFFDDDDGLIIYYYLLLFGSYERHILIIAHDYSVSVRYRGTTVS